MFFYLPKAYLVIMEMNAHLAAERALEVVIAHSLPQADLSRGKSTVRGALQGLFGDIDDSGKTEKLAVGSWRGVKT